MSNKSIMSISDRAAYMVAQNDRYSAIAELADEPTKAALAIVGKTEAEVALKSRDAYMVSGHAIHDIQVAFDPEKWANHDPAFKNAGDLIEWVFSIKSSEASARAKTWEAWGDYSKLDATKKAIWDAGTSPNALYRLTQVPSAMLEEESAKGHNYFTLQEGKDMAKAAKEPKQRVIKPKKWAHPSGKPWDGDNTPDRPGQGDAVFSLPNGDKLLCVPYDDGPHGTRYDCYQLREIKPEPKHKRMERTLDPAAAVKNMTTEQQAAVLAELLASMGKTLAD